MGFPTPEAFCGAPLCRLGVTHVHPCAFLICGCNTVFSLRKQGGLHKSR